jgi:IS30 family transposase
MRSYVWLRVCEVADGRSALACLVEWCSSFGVVYDWASDQGRHFVNNVMQAAARQLQFKHRFTTAYSPWENGTVEVVCRGVLNALRKLCSEISLSFTEWPSMLHIVQSIINSTPSKKLNGTAPVTAFLGLPANNPILSIIPRQGVEVKTLEHIQV